MSWPSREWKQHQSFPSILNHFWLPFSFSPAMSLAKIAFNVSLFPVINPARIGKSRWIGVVPLGNISSSLAFWTAELPCAFHHCKQILYRCIFAILFCISFNDGQVGILWTIAFCKPLSLKLPISGADAAGLNKDLRIH